MYSSFTFGTSGTCKKVGFGVSLLLFGIHRICDKINFSRRSFLSSVCSSLEVFVWLLASAVDRCLNSVHIGG
jgi:hypothetical protein